MLKIFFRHKRTGANSIEGVYAAIDNLLTSHSNERLPYDGATPFAIIRNIVYAFKNRSRNNHMTGDAHYSVIGLGSHTLLTIHDVGSACKGTWYQRFYIKLLWFWLPTLIANRISVISDATKCDVIKLCPWARKKITVIPNPYNRQFEGTPRPLQSGQIPTILHIGTKTNKNLERTIVALSDIQCKLVIVGPLTPLQRKMLTDNRIDYVNKVDIQFPELLEAYRDCDIVSFPSLFEGFGMPVIEGQAAARPVVAGNIPVLRDVAGRDGAIFVDPTDVESIKEGFIAAIENTELRKRVIEAGKANIARYAPETIAEKYNKIYKQL